MNKDLIMAGKIAERVAAAGGRTYFVGGYVRDQILKRENKDIDIEIHGITVRQLEAILDKLGHRKLMGASFGIYGLDHYELDIAMPRSEEGRGNGKADFEAFADPFIGAEKAAGRRDFTINALMQDVCTGEILDFFGGIEDMKQKRIRHVSENSLIDDPLRVLRAAQFAARLDYRIAEDTRELAKTIDLNGISEERIMGEVEKALMKAEKPSVFFEELRKMNQLSIWFPELEVLSSFEQSPDHHPEGNVWNHTMQVLDRAAALRTQAREPLYLMLSALCHDMGKAVTTEQINGKIHAYEHEIKGVPIAEKFLLRLSNKVAQKKYVLNMVRLHMKPVVLVSGGGHTKTYMKMFDDSICPEDLLLLAKSDYLGRVNGDNKAALEEGYGAFEEVLLRNLEKFKELMAKPCVMGRDLAEAGIQPGPLYKEALDYAHKLHLSGVDKESALKSTLAFIRKKK